MDWLPPICTPQPGDELAAKARALPRNQTHILACGTMLQSTELPGRGKIKFLKQDWVIFMVIIFEYHNLYKLQNKNNFISFL